MAPYLSFVVTSRNDNHGGDLLRRMQIFTTSLLEQLKKFNIPSELIFVEWNPPKDKLRLADALQWPAEMGPCSVRIIEVPPELHQAFRYSDKLPLFQMIAKNVGIRRATAPFICATNIDVLFPDELMKYLANRTLDLNAMYRLDRYDVRANIQCDAPISKQFEFCRQNIIRINMREGTFKPEHPFSIWFHQSREKIFSHMRRLMPSFYKFIHKVHRAFTDAVHRPKKDLLNWTRVWFPYKFKPYYLLHFPLLLAFVVNRVKLLRLVVLNIFASPDQRVDLTPPADMRWEEYWEYLDAKKGKAKRRTSNEATIEVRSGLTYRLEESDLATLDTVETAEKECIPQKTLHTNACGDFTLIAKSHWLRLRAYPEWEMYSFNIDSIFCYNAYYAGLEEIFLPDPYRFYHIEHAAGWTPEESDSLKKRMVERGVPWFDWCDCLKMIDEMQSRQAPLVFNDDAWGLGTTTLKETIIDAHGTRNLKGEGKVSRSTFVVELSGGE
jgi:hypothetical protein